MLPACAILLEKLEIDSILVVSNATEENFRISVQGVWLASLAMKNVSVTALVNRIKGMSAKTILKRILRTPANALIASSTNVWESPYLPDKFYPYKGDAKSYFLLKSGEQGRARGEFPIPPENLYFQTFGATTEVNSGKALDDPAQYLRHGKLHIEKMKEILARSDFLSRRGIGYWISAAAREE